jgi:hypothetical protein
MSDLTMDACFFAHVLEVIGKRLLGKEKKYTYKLIYNFGMLSFPDATFLTLQRMRLFRSNQKRSRTKSSRGWDSASRAVIRKLKSKSSDQPQSPNGAIPIAPGIGACMARAK